MKRAIIAGLNTEDRTDLAGRLEASGYQVQVAPTIQRLREDFESDVCSVLFLDSALDGAGGVDLLATLKLVPDQVVVLLLRDDAGRALAKSLCSESICALEMPVDDAAFGKLMDSLDGVVPPVPDRAEEEDARFESMLGNCPAMLEVYEMIAKVAPTTASVLICGESGTGKELVANAIHRRSDRRDQRFVAVNCGAIAENLIESELFGHEKGAFTGASKAHAGVFEQADGGTLFLDEVTEMPEHMQVRLLRVLEAGKVRRVGSEREVSTDVRVIAATNRDPHEAIEHGQFRSDVMFRLAVFPITMPRLAERSDDILLMANHFLAQHNKDNGTDKRFSHLGRSRLMAYDWPGNVRQLRNIVQRAYILESASINVDCLKALLKDTPETSCDHAVNAPKQPRAEQAKQTKEQPHAPVNGSASASASASVSAPGTADAPVPMVSVEVGSSIDDAERALILKTLKEMQGDKKRAAKVLGVSLKTLYNRLNEYEAQAEQDEQDEQQNQPDDQPSSREHAEKDMSKSAS